jgi:hypothetical protein
MLNLKREVEDDLRRMTVFTVVSSRRPEETTSIDRDGFLWLLAAKIALIQPVGYTRLLGRRLLAHGVRAGIHNLIPPHCPYSTGVFTVWRARVISARSAVLTADPNHLFARHPGCLVPHDWPRQPQRRVGRTGYRTSCTLSLVRTLLFA